MANISQENINSLAQVASSIIDGDYIYIYNSRASCFSRIEKSVFFAGINQSGGGMSAEVYAAIQANVETLREAYNQLVSDLANLAFTNLPKTSTVAAFSWPDAGGGDTPTDTPSLSSPTNNSTVNVGTNTGSGVSKTITVKGSHLGTALTASLSGSGFYFGSSGTQTSQTILANNANASSGWTLTVRYEGEDANATGTLTISSSEVRVTVNLIASYQQQGGGDEPTPSGYVDNGLVLHLDCQNAGNQANHWIDLVDGVDFELSNVTTDNDGGMKFTSTNSSYGVAEGAALDIPFSQGTIEVVVKNLSFKNKATPFKCSEVDGIAFGGWNFGSVKGWCMACSDTAATSSRLIWNNSLNDGDLITGYFGMTQATAVVNGVELPTYTNENGNGTYTLTNGVFTINANESSNIMLGKNTNSGNASTYMDGTILAVRVYNRQLSAAEMIQNYNVDKTKYGLS